MSHANTAITLIGFWQFCFVVGALFAARNEFSSTGVTPARTHRVRIQSSRAFRGVGFYCKGLLVHARSLFRSPKKDDANAYESEFLFRNRSERLG